jgi:hypothetical protein
MLTLGGNGLPRDSHYQYQRLIRKYQSSDAEIMEYLPQLMLWNHLGRAASLNALGIRPSEDQRLAVVISSRGRNTLDEEMYRYRPVAIFSMSLYSNFFLR